MLNLIKDNKGARYKSKRVGRGIGSGKGKTCGVGGKGQTARSGVALNGFEGGQMPLFRRLPRRGFNQLGKIYYEVLNIDDIENLIALKRVDASNITLQSLKDAGVFKGITAKLKLLGSGEVKSKFNIEVHSISNSAKEKLEQKGVKVSIAQ